MQLSIVSYLDPTTSAQVRAIQQELSHVTGSTAALNSWQPHVTIGDGIEIDEQDVSKIETAFRTIAANTKPFDVTLSGIGTMDSWKAGADEDALPFVIYVDINVSQPLLQLVNQAGRASSNYKKWYVMPQPYQPHCTLAFADLTKIGFELGTNFLHDRPIAFNTVIDHIALVEKLPDTDREYRRFTF